MPQLHKQSFGLWIAHALAASHPGQPLAVMMKTDTIGSHYSLRIAAIARQNGVIGPHDTHTPTVNLLQNASEHGVPTSNREIFLVNHAPTDACIGIAKGFDVARIIYYNGVNPCAIELRTQASVAHMAPVALQFASGISVPRVFWHNKFGAINGTAINSNAVPAGAALAATLDEAAMQAAFMGLGGPLNPQEQAMAYTLQDWLDSKGVYWSDLAPLPAFGPALPGDGGMVSQQDADRIYMALAYVVAARSWAGPTGPDLRGTHGVTRGYNIACVLASRNGAVHGWALNSNAHNSSRHAETNLIQSLAAAIPAGATLYATLEPCYMCAGLFRHAGGTRCVFGQRDPNMVGNTALAGFEMQETFVSAPFLSPRTLPFGQRLDALHLRQVAALQAAETARRWSAIPRGPGQNDAHTLQRRAEARKTGSMTVRAPDFLGKWTATQAFSHAEINLIYQILDVVKTTQSTPARLRLIENVFATLQQAHLGTVAQQMQEMMPM